MERREGQRPLGSLSMQELIEKPVEPTESSEIVRGIGITGRMQRFPSNSVFWLEKKGDSYDLTYSYVNFPLTKERIKQYQTLDALTVRANVPFEVPEDIPDCTIEKNKVTALGIFSQMDAGFQIQNKNAKYSPLFTDLKEFAGKVATRKYTNGNAYDVYRRAEKIKTESDWGYKVTGYLGGDIMYGMQGYVNEIIRKKMEKVGLEGIYYHLAKFSEEEFEELKPNIEHFMNKEGAIGEGFIYSKMNGKYSQYKRTFHTKAEVSDSTTFSEELVLGVPDTLPPSYVNHVILNALAEGSKNPYSKDEIEEVIRRMVERASQSRSIFMIPNIEEKDTYPDKYLRVLAEYTGAQITVGHLDKRGEDFVASSIQMRRGDKKQEVFGTGSTHNEATMRAIEEMLKRMPQIR